MNKACITRKENNRGVAMISIIIAVAFVSIIGSALLYVTYTNFQMKVANLRSKENFYETDGQLTQVTTNLRYNVMNGGDPKSKLQTITGVTFDTTTGVGGSYNIDGLVSYVSAIPSGQMTVSDDKKTATGYITNPTDSSKKDKFEYSGGTAEIVKIKKEDGTLEMPTNPVTYRLHDFTIKQTNADGYVNTVKTDIDIQVLTISGSSATEGGVGSFSVLMDAPISANSSSFNVLNMYGNGFVSKCENATAQWSFDSNNDYTPPGKKGAGKTAGNAALFMGFESKMNIIGDYLIVYGDLVLTGQSCLYINKGNLTVYGDIYLYDDATIICSGNIYQVKDEPLPGRGTNKSDIYIDDKALSSGAVTVDDLKKHLYPYGLVSQTIPPSNFKKFAQTLAYNDNDLTNDGVLNQILAPNTVVSSTNSNYNKKITEISNMNNVQTNFSEATFYDEKVKVEIFGKNDQNINGQYNGATKRLVFLLGNNTKIQESNTSCTFISKSGLQFQEAHSATLTKMGSEEFDFLLIKSNDTHNVNYQNEVHKLQNSDMGFSGSDYFSPGDFFVSTESKNPNKVVNDMLSCGNGSDGDGGAVETTYESSLSFANYMKDFN